MTKYPTIDNKRYYEIIDKMYKEYQIKRKSHETMKDYCYPKKYKLQNFSVLFFLVLILFNLTIIESSLLLVSFTSL